MPKQVVNSVKGSRRWQRKGMKGIMACIVGSKWKGMGKTNYRRLNKRMLSRERESDLSFFYFNIE
jgi:hypothetical protein